MNRLMSVMTMGVLLGTTLLSARPGMTQSGDAANGVWTLDLEKSTIVSGEAPRSQTRTYEVSGDTIREIVDTTDARGRWTHSDFRGRLDGNDYPVTGHPDSDTVALRRVGADVVQGVHKKSGKPVINATRTIEKDGKTMTVKKYGTAANGEKIDQILFYRKQ
jgi:hypothetical protein